MTSVNFIGTMDRIFAPAFTFLSFQRRISIVHRIVAVFLIIGFLFICFLFVYLRHDPQELYLVVIETCFSVITTLLIIERALDIERRRAQSQFASLDRLALCNSLAELVVFAYIRLFKGETGDIYGALNNISDPRPWELYLYLGKLGSNKMVPLIKDMESFSAQDFVLGIGELQQFSKEKREKDIANRFYAYVSDTNAIIRNLPTVINRAIQTSSTVSDKDLLNMIDEQARKHETAVANKLKTESEAASRYREISNNLSLMVEYYTRLEGQNSDRRIEKNRVDAIMKKLKHWWLPYEY